MQGPQTSRKASEVEVPATQNLTVHGFNLPQWESWFTETYHHITMLLPKVVLKKKTHISQLPWFFQAVPPTGEILKIFGKTSPNPQASVLSNGKHQLCPDSQSQTQTVQFSIFNLFQWEKIIIPFIKRKVKQWKSTKNFSQILVLYLQVQQGRPHLKRQLQG